MQRGFLAELRRLRLVSHRMMYTYRPDGAAIRGLSANHFNLLHWPSLAAHREDGLDEHHAQQFLGGRYKRRRCRRSEGVEQAVELARRPSA
jgi:hypothetical protein